MDYTLQGIVERVRVDKLDDSEFDTGIIGNFVNDTQRDIFNQFELPFQEKIFAGTVPSSSSMFNVPKDLALLQSVSMADVPGFSATKMNWRDFFDKYPDNTSAEPGKPTAWTLYAGNIIFDKPTDADYVLTLFYIRKPITLTVGTQVPEIPYEFEELLVLGAYIRCLKFNEDFDQAAFVEVEYNKNLDLLVTRYGGRMSPGSVKMKSRQISTRGR
jgi:hypothetical protein